VNDFNFQARLPADIWAEHSFRFSIPKSFFISGDIVPTGMAGAGFHQ